MKRMPLSMITLFIILLTAQSPNCSFAAYDYDKDFDTSFAGEHDRPFAAFMKLFAPQK